MHEHHLGQILRDMAIYQYQWLALLGYCGARDKHIGNGYNELPIMHAF